jgi:hypothetical protein
MAGPNTLNNVSLNFRDRLKQRLHAFFEGYIWDENDPKLAVWKSRSGVTASYHPSAATAKYFLNKFIDDITKDLLGTEWLLDYPAHYLSINESHVKVITQVNTKLGGVAILGAWRDSENILLIQTTNKPTDKDPFQSLKTVVYEYAHSNKLGLETPENWQSFEPKDWFHPDMLDDNGLPNYSKIHKNFISLALGPSLAVLDYGYIARATEVTEDNPAFQRKSVTAITKAGYIATLFMEEIVVRATADIALSNARHDDIYYLFQPGIENVLGPKAIDRIKKYSWPRLPENTEGNIILNWDKLWD